MKRRNLLLVLATLAVAILVFKGGKAPLKPIVILYENDVHCSIEGYAKLAGLKNSMPDSVYVGLVSSGDYLQGGTAGALSRGSYIMDIQKVIGYDALTLGNHEFDYFTDRLLELSGQYQLPLTCANLYDSKTGKACFPAYILKEYGPKKVAFIGATTPETATSEYYALHTEDGSEIFDLCPDRICDLVQEAADKARKEGADYVVVLSHLGEVNEPPYITSHALIAATNGIDVLLDGHTHSIVPGEYVNNKDGKPVLVSQTGTAFKNIGKLVIAKDGTISNELVPVADLTEEDAAARAAIEDVKARMLEITSRVIGDSEVDIRINNSEGERMVRKAETTGGDLLADALRYKTKADLAIVNGGGVRCDIPAGTLTYGDIVADFPFENFVYKIEATGDDILAVLGYSTRHAPDAEDGDYPQCSGIRFTLHTGDRSLSGVEVETPEGKWVPLQPEKTYTVGTMNYCVVGGGFGRLWQNCKVLERTDILYRDAVVDYIIEVLGGHVGQEYAKPQGRSVITK